MSRLKTLLKACLMAAAIGLLLPVVTYAMQFALIWLGGLSRYQFSAVAALVAVPVLYVALRRTT